MQVCNGLKFNFPGFPLTPIGGLSQFQPAVTVKGKHSIIHSLIDMQEYLQNLRIYFKGVVFSRFLL